jgi:4-amino-4-deoxy-L-arabinose transferase-like glycosyltransferase
VLAALLAAGAAFWCWLAFSVHTQIVIGGESDCYLDRAEDLLDAKIVLDGFHPLGLPVLVAAVAWCGLATFTAGRLVAIACGLLLVACTYRIARTFASRLAAVFAAVAVGASQFVLVGAVQVCSDVPAAAFATLALWVWTRVCADRVAKARWLVAGGLAVGLAGFMRTPGLVVAPAFLPVLLGIPWRERWRRCGYTLLGAAVGFGPHVLLSWYAGLPAKNASQLVWKYRRLSDDELLAWLRDPGPFPWAEVPGWMLQGLGDLLGYLTHGLGRPWSVTPVGAVPVVVSLLMTAAMALPLLMRQRAASVLALGAWSCAIAMCLFTLPMDRLTVPMAAPAVLLAVHAFSRWRPMVAVACAAALAGAALAVVPRALDDFERMHAREELEALQRLAAQHGEWITVATTAIGLERHVRYGQVPLRLSNDAALAPSAHWQQLLDSVAGRHADFVLVGRTRSPVAWAALSAVPPPASHEVRERNGALVIARRGAGADPFELAEVTVRGQECHLRIRLAAWIDAAQLLAVGFVLREGRREREPLLLQPVADGSFAATIPGSAFATAGDREFVPALVTRDGVIRRGRAVTVQR